MEIIISILRSICSAILFPPFVFILLILLLIFHFKNKKRAAMQKMMVGSSVESALELTLSQFIFGVLGGIIGSVILNLCGVVFNENCRIEVLFIASVILTAIRPSFVCFSYSASVLGLISIVLSIIARIIPNADYTHIFKLDILHVMMFVGVMHVVEGIMVFLDGHRGAFPILIRKEDKILGGYSLKRYWVLPLAIMIMGNMSNIYSEYNSISIFEIPNYWSMFKSSEQIEMLKTLFLSIISFYAVVGYSSVTYTRTKREKAVSSGLYIFSYGILLILVSQAARIGIAGEIFVVIFAPAAHELMFKLQRDSEMKRKPKFVSDENGLVVLEVGTDSRMNEFNISVNSKIISVNNECIECEKDIYSILKKNLHKAIIKIKDCDGVIKEINYTHDNNRLGILLVPSHKKEKGKDSSDNTSKNFKNILDSINKNKCDN